jgi:hypothetical protein
MMRTLRTGDRIRLRHGIDGREWFVVVNLASDNGRSLLVAVSDFVDGYYGAIPLLQHEDGVYRDLINAVPFELLPVPGMNDQ